MHTACFTAAFHLSGKNRFDWMHLRFSHRFLRERGKTDSASAVISKNVIHFGKTMFVLSIGSVRHFSCFRRKCRSLTLPQRRLRPALFLFSLQMPVVRTASAPAESGAFLIFAANAGRSHCLSVGRVRHFSCFRRKCRSPHCLSAGCVRRFSHFRQKCWSFPLPPAARS